MWRFFLHPPILTSSPTYFIGVLLSVCSGSLFMIVGAHRMIMSFILDFRFMEPKIVNWTDCLSEEEYEKYMATTIIIDTITQAAIPRSKDLESMHIDIHRLISALMHETTFFFVTYTFSHIPGGIVADRLGGKAPIVLAMAISAIVTIIFPLAILYQPLLILLIQTLRGFALGLYFPSVATIIARWSAPAKRASFAGVIYCGSFFGHSLLMMFAQRFLIKYGWVSGYIFIGMIGLIVTFLAYIWLYSDPESHLFLTDEEKLNITEKTFSVLPRNEMAPIPWVKMASSINVWAIIVVGWGHKWTEQVLSVDLTIFMERITDSSVYEFGILGATPYWLMSITCLASGFFADFLIQKLNITINSCRKVMLGCACFIPAVSVLLASYQGCGFTRIFVLFVIANMGWGVLFSSLNACVIDLSPNYAGTMMGIVNGISATAWMASGYLRDSTIIENTMEEWKTLFWVSYLIVGFTYLFTINFGTFEVRKWNNIRMRSYKR